MTVPNGRDGALQEMGGQFPRKCSANDGLQKKGPTKTRGPPYGLVKPQIQLDSRYHATSEAFTFQKGCGLVVVALHTEKFAPQSGP